MNIVIVGCGKIGSTILGSLLGEGHNIVAVDNDASVIKEISDQFDCMCVCGSATDCNILTQAEVGNAELFVATTGSDELNMLACYFAKKIGAKHTVTRIRDPQYNDSNISFLRSQLGISMILNPDRLAAQDIFQILMLPGAVKVESFSKRSLIMVELDLHENSPLCDTPLMELKKKVNLDFLVSAIQRDEQVFIPNGNFVLKEGDHIAIAAEYGTHQKILKKLEYANKKQSRNIMIIGASRTAYYLSKMLTASGCSVKIIEKNHARCQEFSEVMPSVTVICADAADQEALSEEGITSMDAVVSLTGMDEQNILFTYYASSRGVPRTIAKVNRTELRPIVKKMGLDKIVSSRMTVSNVIIRYARGLHNSMGCKMETLHQIMDDKAEVCEFLVDEGFEKKNVPLKELKLNEGVLIAGIVRGKTTVIPGGDDVIQVNDRVVVVAQGRHLNALSDIISV